jgi:hypothetical protein
MGIETTNIWIGRTKTTNHTTQSWVPPRGFSSASLNSLRDPTPGSSQTKAMSIACLPASWQLETCGHGDIQGTYKTKQGDLGYNPDILVKVNIYDMWSANGGLITILIIFCRKIWSANRSNLGYPWAISESTVGILIRKMPNETCRPWGTLFSNQRFTASWQL